MHRGRKQIELVPVPVPKLLPERGIRQAEPFLDREGLVLWDFPSAEAAYDRAFPSPGLRMLPSSFVSLYSHRTSVPSIELLLHFPA